MLRTSLRILASPDLLDSPDSLDSPNLLASPDVLASPGSLTSRAATLTATLTATLATYGMAVLALIQPAHAEDHPDSYLKPHEYGELYVLEQNDKKVPTWTLDALYSYGLSNPYINLHGITLGGEYNLSRYVSSGLLVTYYVSTATHLMDVLSQQLATNDITASVKVPGYNLFATLTVKPLSGHLNFLGNKPIELEFTVRLGAGYITYPANSTVPALFWSLRPAFFLTKSLTIQTGLGQLWEDPLSPKGVFNLRVEAGLGIEL